MGKRSLNTDIVYAKFVKFTLYLFLKIEKCNLKVKKAIDIANDFFLENPEIDHKLKDLLITLLNEWDTSFHEICDLATYLYISKNFEELKNLITQNPDLRDILYN